MIEENIKFGGETSGHIFYKENNYFDDGLFGAIKLLNYFASSNEKLSTLVDTIAPIINTGEIRLQMSDSERDDFLLTITKELNKNNKNYIGLDGMRVEYDNGFWLLRKSNTEPHITLYCEANNQESYQEILNDLRKYISTTKYNLTEF